MENHHKGWYQANYLPHFDAGEVCQVITYRLDDSLPHSKLRELQQHLQSLPPEKCDTAERKQIEIWLDVGYGSCILRHPHNAQLIINNWQHFHRKRYDLIAWVVMPNHVHLMIQVYNGHPLRQILQSWKNYSSRRFVIPDDVHKRPYWQRDYWDRYVRNEAHYHNAVWYIEQNPVKAGLVQRAEDWAFSSAGSIDTPSKENTNNLTPRA